MLREALIENPAVQLLVLAACAVLAATFLISLAVTHGRRFALWFQIGRGASRLGHSLRTTSQCRGGRCRPIALSGW
jgi:hypothetical protein